MTITSTTPTSLELATSASTSIAEEVAIEAAPEPPAETTVVENGPSRGAFRELMARRQQARAEARGGEHLRGEQVAGRMKAMRTLRQAVTQGVRDLVENAELTDDQAHALKDATQALHAAISEVVPSLRHGEVDGVGEQVSEAISTFVATVEDVLGGDVFVSEESTPVESALESADQEDAAVQGLADSFVDDIPPFDDDQQPWEPMAVLEDSITHALEGFLQSLQEREEAPPPNPYASYFAAVQEVTDPSAQVTSAAITVA